MILEIENITRSIGDIRKAIFSLEAQITTAEQQQAKEEMIELLDELDFKKKGLEFFLTQGTTDEKS